MKELIAISYSGLADRIQLMLAGYRLAQTLGAKFTFIWEPTGHCGCRFDDVLTTDAFEVTHDKMYHAETPLLDAASMPWSYAIGVVHDWPTDVLRLVAYPKE